MKTQDLLNQFFTKAQSGKTVTDDRKWYDTMISRKQRNFLVGVYKKETNDWDAPCEYRFVKFNEWTVSLAKPMFNGSYKITFEK